MFTMAAELISVASFILMFIVLFCVVKMYSAVMADYERRQGVPVQGPEMEGQERAGRGAADRRLRGQRQRGRIGTNQRTGRRPIPQEHDERRC